MITVNRLDDQIIGFVNGEQFSVTFTEEKYSSMKELENAASKAATMEDLKLIVAEFKPLLEESYKEIVETASPYIHVNKDTNTFYLKWNDRILKSMPLPTSFATKLVEVVEKGIDTLPLIKCWVRYLRPAEGRPEYTIERGESFAWFINAPYVNSTKTNELMEKHGLSAEAAIKRATTNQVAITQEGLIVGYKVSEEVTDKFVLDEDGNRKIVSRYTPEVDEDTGVITYNKPEFVEDLVFKPAIMGEGGDAFYCGDKLGHRIRVGERHYLPKWSQVGAPMGPGLHFGGLSYIKNYQHEGTVTHNIFVDPADIHSVSMQGDGAVTCKSYFVHSSFAGVNKNIYHSSTYSQLKDAEFQQELQALLQAQDEKTADIQEVKEDFTTLNS
jgi:hypothetical protein